MEILEVWLSGNPGEATIMRAPRGRASKIVNWCDRVSSPPLIHNLCVFRQAIHAALENPSGTKGLCAPRSHRHACSRAADPDLLV
jgi:hypothetical protein